MPRVWAEIPLPNRWGISMMNTLDKFQVVKVSKLNFSFHNVVKVSFTFIDIMGNVHVNMHRGNR